MLYGKMSFIEVTGVVRLAPLTDPLPPPPPAPARKAAESDYESDYEDEGDYAGY